MYKIVITTTVTVRDRHVAPTTTKASVALCFASSQSTARRRLKVRQTVRLARSTPTAERNSEVRISHQVKTPTTVSNWTVV